MHVHWNLDGHTTSRQAQKTVADDPRWTVVSLINSAAPHVVGSGVKSGLDLVLSISM